MPRFAQAKLPTPILNTPNFRAIFGGEDGSSLPLDGQGLLRAVESVAFPKTSFELLEQCSENIFRVKTDAYQGEPLYVDSRFLEETHTSHPAIKKPLQKEKMVADLLALQGTSYVWGGNCLGIPEMLTFYPPQKNLSEKLLKIWTFEGMDCSGLLYFVSEGTTPRNTSQLIHFGKSLPLEGKDVNQIIDLVRPLDLIVWKGHVLIIIDSKRVIESRPETGVALSPLDARLKEIFREKKPASFWHEGTFVINRWI